MQGRLKMNEAQAEMTVLAKLEIRSSKFETNSKSKISSEKKRRTGRDACATAVEQKRSAGL
jgi:hypothetical protein